MFVECFLTQDAKAEEAALKGLRKVDSEVLVFHDSVEEQPDWSDPMDQDPAPAASPTEVASSQDLEAANEEPTVVPKEEPTVIPEGAAEPQPENTETRPAAEKPEKKKKPEKTPEKTPAAAEQKPDPEKKIESEAEPRSLCPVPVHSDASLEHTKAGTSF